MTPFLQRLSICVILLFTAGPVLSQETLDRYTCSNGMVITLKDSVTIGVGSYPNGVYRHIYMSLLIAPLFEGNIEFSKENYALFRGKEGTTVPVRKIKMSAGKVYLFVALDGEAPYLIEVEEAIGSCELAFCRPDGYLTQEEFSKLILMQQAVDEGTLTEERFYELRAEFMAPPPPAPEHME